MAKSNAPLAFTHLSAQTVALVRRMSKVRNRGPWAGEEDSLNGDVWTEVRFTGLELIRAALGDSHPMYKEFDETTCEWKPWAVERAYGILWALQRILDGDLLRSTRALVAGEVFTDLLDMAQHLHEEGYKLAAAVVVGASLEAHLRRLCVKAGIDTEYADKKGSTKPKKSETLNAELCKAGVYQTADQKQVTAWLAVRNDAAHGHDSRVDAGKVEFMVGGVRLFISQHPA